MNLTKNSKMINDFLTYLTCYTIQKYKTNTYISLDELYARVLEEQRNIYFLTKYLKSKVENSSIILQSKSRFKYWIKKQVKSNIFSFRKVDKYKISKHYNKKMIKNNRYFFEKFNLEVTKLSNLGKFHLDISNDYNLSFKYYYRALKLKKFVLGKKTYECIISLYSDRTYS